jgi:hypothetical protein
MAYMESTECCGLDLIIELEDDSTPEEIEAVMKRRPYAGLLLAVSIDKKEPRLAATLAKMGWQPIVSGLSNGNSGNKITVWGFPYKQPRSFTQRLRSLVSRKK